MNVTDVAAHTGLDEADILTLAGKLGFTVIVTVFDVVGLPVAHSALDVRTQVTRSPFDNPAFV